LSGVGQTPQNKTVPRRKEILPLPRRKEILPLPRRKEIVPPTKRVSPYVLPPATFDNRRRKRKRVPFAKNRSTARTEGQSAMEIGTLKTDSFSRGAPWQSS
jgi:hypothetical protein